MAHELKCYVTRYVSPTDDPRLLTLVLGRSPTDGKFHCPGHRCAYQHVKPKYMQSHARACPLITDGIILEHQRAAEGLSDSSPTALPQHVQSAQLPFACFECPESFSTNTRRTHHRKITHQRMCVLTFAAGSADGDKPLKTALFRKKERGTFCCPGDSCSFQHVLPQSMQEHAKNCTLLASSSCFRHDEVVESTGPQSTASPPQDSHHAQPVPLSCSVCAETFISKAKLLLHCSSVHQPRCVVRCSVQTEDGSEPPELSLFRNEETGNFHCPGRSCAKQYPYPKSIRGHVKSCSLALDIDPNLPTYRRPSDGLRPVNGLPIHDGFSCAVDSGCRFVSRAYSTWLDHYADVHKRHLPDRLLGLPLREPTHYKRVRVQTLSSFSRLVDYFVVDAPPLLIDPISDHPTTSVLGVVNIARQTSPGELDAHEPTQPLAGTEQIRAEVLERHRPTIADDECVDTSQSQLELAETGAPGTDQNNSDLVIDYSQEDKLDLGDSIETASDYDQLELDSMDIVDFGVDTSSSCAADVLPDLSMTTELAGVCLVPEHQAAAFLDLTIDSDAEEDNRVHLHARQRELKRFTVSLPEATVPKASPVLPRQSSIHEAQSSDAEAFGTHSWSTEISDGTSENSAPSVRSQEDAVGDFVLAADSAKSAKMRIPVSGRIALDSSGQSASHAEELRTHDSHASVEDAWRVNVEKEKYRQQFANFRRQYNVDKKEAYSILVQFRGSITEAWDYVDRWCRDMSSRHLLEGNAAFDYLKAADGNFRIAEACIKVTARFPASTSKRSMSSRDMHCDEDPCRSKKARRRTDHR